MIENLVDLSGLSEDDQLSMWIGRVAKLDARIETTLHTIYEVLLGYGGLGWATVPQMTNQKVRGIRAMLAASEKDISHCLAALAQIEAAHKLRNLAVHGFWYRPDPVGTRFSLQPLGSHGGDAKVHWDIEEFKQCYHQLRRANMISGQLMFYLQSWDDDDHPFAQFRLGSIEVMNGRFTLREPPEREGAETYDYTDEAAAEALRKELELRTLEFRARREGMFPPASEEDLDEEPPPDPA